LGRVLAMLVNEATSALMEGVASVQDIDTAMQLGTNYPRGPLTWADYVGLDVILAILNHLEDEYGEDRYCAMPLLRQMVDAGKLGRKAGEGFYSYHPEHVQPSH
jgi:3-hydroxybutyryl-CoA dehydrogenase